MLYYAISNDKIYTVVVEADNVLQARSKAAVLANNLYGTTYVPSDFCIVK